MPAALDGGVCRAHAIPVRVAIFGFPMTSRLPAIPVIDVREGGPLRHAQLRAAQARALRDACLRFFPRAALPLIPTLDRLFACFFRRSRLASLAAHLSA